MYVCADIVLHMIVKECTHQRPGTKAKGTSVLYGSYCMIIAKCALVFAKGTELVALINHLATYRVSSIRQLNHTHKSNNAHLREFQVIHEACLKYYGGETDHRESWGGGGCN